jgi:hypothetical protein
MAEIFKRAYDEVNRRLNGSGLSSIVHREDGGPVIKRFGGGYTDADAGVEETSYGGGVEDWGISAADMEAAYSTGAFGPELAEESFFDLPDVESQRVHGTSPFDIYRHGEAYGKPPGSREQISARDTSLSDFTGVGEQPSPEMQRRMERHRQEGLRGMIQGGFDSPEAYRDYMNKWKSEAEKSRSDAYWAEYPYGNWVTETFGDIKGTSLVLPEQAPISRDEAINNVLEDDTLSPEEKQEQINHIFIYDDVVNRDMGRLKTASRKHTEDWKARDRAKGYSSIAPQKRRTYKEGGKIMPGGLSNLKKSININGQPHSLAWIRPDEASALKAMGGSGKKVEGIPAYFYADQGSYDSGDTYDSVDVQDTVGPDEGGYSWDWGSTGGYDYSTDKKADPGKDVDTGYNVPGYSLADRAEVLGTTVDAFGKIGTAEAKSDPSGLAHQTWLDEKSNIKGGFLGLFGDSITNREALRGARKVGYDKWRATAGKYSRDPGKDYDEWFAGQNKDALLEGYAIGDPFGKAMEFQMNLVNAQLQDKFREAKENIAVGLDDDEEFQMTKEELQEAVKGIEGLKGFTPYSGIDYPVWAPGGTAVGLMNLLSSTVIGTGTVNGIGVHVHKDGSVTAISPEDSPGFTSGEDTGNVVEDRRRRRPVREVASVSEEVTETPATGMAGLLAKRPDVPSPPQSIQSQFNALANLYGRERAAEMLNQPENIFA